MILNLFYIKLFFILASLVISAIVVVYHNYKSLMIVIITFYFFPKTRLIELAGVPVFYFVLIILSLAMMAAFFISKKSLNILKEDVYFIGSSFLVFFFQYSLGTFVNMLRYSYLDNFQYVQFIHYFSVDLFGLSYLLCSFKFLPSFDSLDKIFKLIFALGLVLCAEFYYSVFFGAPLFSKYVFDGMHMFKSLFLASCMKVSIWAALTSIISVYLYTCSKRMIYFCCIFPPLIVSVYNCNRSVFMTTLAVVMFIFLHNPNSKTNTMKKIKGIFLIALVSVVGFYLINEMIDSVSFGTVHLKQKFFNLGSSASTNVRIGQSIRAVQIFVHNMPFGSGQSMGRYMYGTVSIPILSKNSYIFSLLPQTYIGYARVSSNGIIADAQIGIISFMVSYGLLGLLPLLCFLRNLSKFFINTTVRKHCVNHNMLTFIRGAFVFYFIYFLFKTNPVLYIAFFTFYRAQSLLKHSANAECFNKKIHYSSNRLVA